MKKIIRFNIGLSIVVMFFIIATAAKPVVYSSDMRTERDPENSYSF